MINRINTISELLNFPGFIEIETNISEKGLPTFEIYGLISKSIDESKKRVKVSLENSGFEFPLKNILVNISPAHIFKSGTHYDFPIAVSIILNQIEYIKEGSIFIGELSLDGTLKDVENIFYLVISAIERGFKNIYVPASSINKLIKIDEVNIYPIYDLKSLRELNKIEPSNQSKNKENRENTIESTYSKIRGSYEGKKAIACSLIGKHSIHLQGPPGVGKSVLAKSLRDLAPFLSIKDSISVSKIYSYSGISRENDFFSIPFRSPHPLTSYSSMFGSYSSKLHVGEVTLANKGILFLDEFPEFNRLVIEGLRGPLEDKRVNLSRAGFKNELESDFILVTTSNPCKCGYFNHSKRSCVCNPADLRRYQSRMSGPIEDRIDIKVILDEYSDKCSNDSKLNSKYDFLNFKKFIQEKILLREELLKDVKDCGFKQNYMYNLITQKYISSRNYNLLTNELKNTSISERVRVKILNLIFTVCLFNNRDTISFEDVIEGLSLSFKNINLKKS